MNNVKDNRDKYIGGSDVAKIFNIQGSKFELIKEKAYNQVKQFDTNYMYYGREMEDKIRGAINKSDKCNFKPDTIIIEDLNIRANVDGVDYKEQVLLEIKTGKSYGDMRSNKSYLLQMYFYLLVANMDKIILAMYERDENMSLVLDEDKIVLEYFSKESLEEELKGVLKNKPLFDYIKDFWIEVDKVKTNKITSEEDLLPSTVKDLSFELRRLEQKKANLEKQINDFKESLYEEMSKRDIKGFKLVDGTSITLVKPTSSIKRVLNTKKIENELELNEEFYEDKETKKKGYVTIRLGK